VLQPLWWRCVDCVIHHERDAREEQQYIYVARTRNNREIMACELYCCLLPQCEALRTCRSSFPIATHSNGAWGVKILEGRKFSELQVLQPTVSHQHLCFFLVTASPSVLCFIVISVEAAWIWLCVSLFLPPVYF